MNNDEFETIQSFDEEIKVDLSAVDTKFNRLEPGRHKARIVGCKMEIKEYMRTPKNPKCTGRAITWTYQTFGNDNMSQNGKKIFQSTPLDGMFARTTRSVILAALPDSQENSFKPRDVLGKEVEIELIYNKDRATGEERKFPNVTNVFPLVGGAGSIGSIPNWTEDEITF